MGQYAITGEGGLINIPVHLSEVLSYYPVVIPFKIGGTSDQNDHDLIDGELLIEKGQNGVIPVNIFEDYVLEPDETLSVQLNKPLNAALNQGITVGDKSTYTLTITDRNLPPNVELTISQNEELAVKVTALVRDPNKKDEHTFSWVLENEQMQTIPTSDVIQMLERWAYFTFVSNEMEAGLYKLTVTVTDDNIEPLSNTQVLYLHITNQDDFSDSFSGSFYDFSPNLQQEGIDEEEVLITDQLNRQGIPHYNRLSACSGPCSHAHEHICVEKLVEKSGKNTEQNDDISWQNSIMHILDGVFIYSF